MPVMNKAIDKFVLEINIGKNGFGGPQEVAWALIDVASRLKKGTLKGDIMGPDLKAGSFDFKTKSERHWVVDTSLTDIQDRFAREKVVGVDFMDERSTFTDVGGYGKQFVRIRFTSYAEVHIFVKENGDLAAETHWAPGT